MSSSTTRRLLVSLFRPSTTPSTAGSSSAATTTTATTTSTINNKSQPSNRIWTAYQILQDDLQSGAKAGSVQIEWGTGGGKLSQSWKHLPEQGKQGRTQQEQILKQITALARDKMQKDGYTWGNPPGDLKKDSDTNTNNDIDTSSDKQTTNTTKPSSPSSNSSIPLPMLATPFIATKHLPQWKKNNPDSIIYVQPKMDGIRCLADLQTGHLYSRTRLPIQGFEHISETIMSSPWRQEFLKDKVTFLDGELYNHGESFQSIVSKIRRVTTPHPENIRREILFHVFDAISDEPFAQRWLRIKTHLSIQQSSSTTTTYPITTIPCDEIPLLQFDPELELNKAITNKYEGVMFRTSPPNSTYRSNIRSQELFKHKEFEQDEFRVVKLVKHREKDTLGAVQLLPVDAPLHDTSRQFNATPAASADDKQEMWDHRTQYEDGSWFATVKYFSLTTDKIPRFPVLVGFRHKDDVDGSLAAKATSTSNNNNNKIKNIKS
jgi:ATP-dependent DNA ligase